MDTNLLLIVIISSIIFVGLVVWKLIWFYKKVMLAELDEKSSDESSNL